MAVDGSISPMMRALGIHSIGNILKSTDCFSIEKNILHIQTCLIDTVEKFLANLLSPLHGPVIWNIS